MKNMLQLFVGAWLHPWQTMQMVKEQPEDTSIKPTMLYIVVLGLIGGLITGIMGTIFPPPTVQSGQLAKSAVWLSVPLLPLFYFIGSFLSTALVWGIVAGFIRGTAAEYKTVYRFMAVPVAFYPISTLLAPIPMAGQWLAIALNLWATVVFIGGVVIVMNAPKVRTIVTFILIFVTFVALAFLAAISARQASTGFPATGDFDLGAENFDLNDEELDAQLENLQKTPAAAPGSPKK